VTVAQNNLGLTPTPGNVVELKDTEATPKTPTTTKQQTNKEIKGKGENTHRTNTCPINNPRTQPFIGN